MENMMFKELSQVELYAVDGGKVSAKTKAKAKHVAKTVGVCAGTAVFVVVLGTMPLVAAGIVLGAGIYQWANL
jgi:hypothetical protein